MLGSPSSGGPPAWPINVGASTSWRRSSAGRTRSQVRQVSVKPCRHTMGGPAPPRCSGAKAVSTPRCALRLVARRGRAVAGVAVLRPRAWIQASGPEAGVLEREQVVTRGDARAAGGDDGRAVADAGGLEDRAEGVDRREPALLVDGLARRDAARARDVAG